MRTVAHDAGMLKRLLPAGLFQKLAGEAIAAWLKLVRYTSRFQDHPSDFFAVLGDKEPYIVGMWHGQHWLVPFMNRGNRSYTVLVSRSGDGEIIATASRRLGLGLIRGSGGRAAKQREKGGAAALRAMVATLGEGINVGLTADVPRDGGIVGPGIITLARLSGRPIVPVAVATSNMIQLDNWDRAVISLPFSRGVFVVGDLVTVPRELDAEALEAKRRELSDALDAVHRRAYALIGRPFRRAGLET